MSFAPITNARDVPLNMGGSSPVPMAETALYGILEPCTFVFVTKRQNQDYVVDERYRPVETQASVQPLTTRDLEIKREGERRWQWLKVFALPNLRLRPGDIIRYGFDPEPYRIMATKDWAQKGYTYYEMVLDYQVPQNYDFAAHQ